jgi:hypothetical protein
MKVLMSRKNLTILHNIKCYDRLSPPPGPKCHKPEDHDLNSFMLDKPWKFNIHVMIVSERAQFEYIEFHILKVNHGEEM